MQQATFELHKQFTRAETQLSTLRNELECRLDKEYLNGSINEFNPFNLLERIRRLEQRIPKLKQDCTSILESKKRIIDITKVSVILWISFKILECTSSS